MPSYRVCVARPVPQVSDLKENRKYQFQVRAANMAGVGIPSLPSDTFLCEEWTIAVPGAAPAPVKSSHTHTHATFCSRISIFSTGPPHDLQIREVRSDSVLLLWKPPVYQGRDPVNGFYVDIKEAEASNEAWRGVNTKATENRFLKVSAVCLPAPPRSVPLASVCFLLADYESEGGRVVRIPRARPEPSWRWEHLRRHGVGPGCDQTWWDEGCSL